MKKGKEFKRLIIPKRVSKPVKVKFHTRAEEKVSFRGYKRVSKPVEVKFYTRKIKKEIKLKNRERAEKLLSLLTEEEKEQFINAVETDFGCQWEGGWNKPGIFEELYKLLRKKLKGEKKFKNKKAELEYCKRVKRRIYLSQMKKSKIFSLNKKEIKKENSIKMKTIERGDSYMALRFEKPITLKDGEKLVMDFDKKVAKIIKVKKLKKIEENEKQERKILKQNKKRFR